VRYRRGYLLAIDFGTQTVAVELPNVLFALRLHFNKQWKLATFIWRALLSLLAV
jgi:hypothetical protein